jgi:hypothetical protein
MTAPVPNRTSSAPQRVMAGTEGELREHDRRMAR